MLSLKSGYLRLLCALLAYLLLNSVQASGISEIYRISRGPAPGPMAVDSRGDLYFAILGGGILVSSEGNAPTQFLAPIVSGYAHLRDISFLVFDSEDSLYLGGEFYRWTPFGPAPTEIVFKITAQGSVTELYRDEAGINSIQLDSITDAKIDRYGNLYLSGYVSDNIVRIGAEGQLSEVLTGPVLSEGIPFENPASMIFDQSDNLYIAATGSSNVIRVSNSGEITEVFSDVVADSSGSQFSSPNSISMNQFGELFVTSVSPYGGALIIYPDGEISQVMDQSGDGTGTIIQYGAFGHVEYGLEFIGEPSIGVRKAVAGPGGDFFMISAYSDNLFRIDRSTKITTVLGRSINTSHVIDHPQDLLVSPQGDVFVSSYRDRKIIKLDAEAAQSDDAAYAPVVSIRDTFNDFPDGTVRPVLRFYNSRDNAFFYTSSVDEANAIIARSDPGLPPETRWPYVLQGVTFSAAHSYGGSVPLHRFYNYSTGHHFFTAFENEYQFVLQQIERNVWPFTYEGVAFHVYLSNPTNNPVGTVVPVFRFFSSFDNRHFYTGNKLEASVLLRDDNWTYEGVAFYGETL